MCVIINPKLGIQISMPRQGPEGGGSNRSGRDHDLLGHQCRCESHPSFRNMEEKDCAVLPVLCGRHCNYPRGNYWRHLSADPLWSDIPGIRRTDVVFSGDIVLVRGRVAV